MLPMVTYDHLNHQILGGIRMKESIISVIGYLGLLTILYGLIVREDRDRKILFPVGATLMIASAVFPKVNGVFLISQVTAGLAGWMTLLEMGQKTKITAVAIGTGVGIVLVLYLQASMSTLIGVFGLTMIAVGFATDPANVKKQNGAMAIGGAFMVVYSGCGLAMGNMQALPWLLLNVPFTALSLWACCRAPLAATSR